MTEEEKLNLAKMVKKAKGSMSLDEFASKTGVSKFQLSRIMNGKFKESPRKATIQAILDHAESPEIFRKAIDTTTYEVGKESSETAFLPHKALSAVMESETKRCKAAILDSLAAFSLPWQNIHPGARQEQLDFNLVLKIDNCPIDTWKFFFLFSYGSESLESQARFIGSLYFYHPRPTEKVSLVFTDEFNYETFTSWPYSFNDQFCNTTLSSILIEPEKMEIKEETYTSVHETISRETVESLYIPTISHPDGIMLDKIWEWRSARKQSAPYPHIR